MTSRLPLVALAACSLALAGCGGGSGSGKSSSTTTHAATAVSCEAGSAPSFSGAQSAYDAPAFVEPTKALQAQVSEPTLTSAASGRPGYKIAQVKVTAMVRTNGIFAVDPASFVLVDKDGHRCPQPAVNPLHAALSVAQVDEQHTGSGVVAFLVPTETNLSDYSVYYLAAPGASRAAARWSEDGSAPTPTAATTCSNAPQPFKSDGLKLEAFGKPHTEGDQTVSQVITPSAPTMRDLPASDKQPNNVTGVVIQVKVEAKGALGYVGRNQFELVDQAHNRCSYSELGSDGENLSNDLVDAGKSKTYTLIFWTPKGSAPTGWTLYYLPDPAAKKATAGWNGKAAAPATPSTSPSASSSSATSTPPASSTSK